MPMTNYDILGYAKLKIHFKVNINGEACSWKFNHLFHDA
jgi:hypothetical protein